MDDVAVPSPLKRFRSAKADMQGLFEDMLSTLEELISFLAKSTSDSCNEPRWLSKDSEGAVSVHDVDTSDVLDMGKETIRKTKTIIDTVTRDTMKAVFFGRTSNGKSTLINSMLSNKILPSGFGHTTNCFCRIRGSDSDTGYFEDSQSGAKSDLKDLKQLAHALHSSGTDFNQTANIFWPRTKCKLLQDYVEILDSPGLDLSEHYDTWIDKHCKDADILVLVVNAESALNLTERKFIAEVHKKLVSPSIFICFNRWDCIDGPEVSSEQIQGVKRQHLDSAFNLLVQDLGMSVASDSDEDIPDRIFLLSAREAVDLRTNPDKGKDKSTGQTLRYAEFQRFEKSFEECMSLSAIEKRFESHTKSGFQMAQLIAESLSELSNRVDGFCTQTEAVVVAEQQEQKQLIQRASSYQKKMLEFTNTTIKNLETMLVDVMNTEGKLAIETSVRSYEDRVGLFDKDDLTPYDTALKDHVLASVRIALVRKCKEELNKVYQEAQQIYPNTVEDIGDFLRQPIALKEYPGSVPIRCDNLVERFQPDIKFRFSFGALGPMITDKMNQFKQEFVKRLFLPALQLQDSEHSETTSHDIPQMAIEFVQSPVGAITLVGIAYSTPIRNILHYGILIYGAMYIFQYTTYTKAQQIVSFKRQLVEHASDRLSDTSSQLGYYLIEDLNRHLKFHTEQVLEQMNSKERILLSQISNNQESLSTLSDFNARTAELCKQAENHELQFKSFEDKYLRHQKPKLGQISSPFNHRKMK